METLGFWCALILLTAGLAKGIAAVFPREWDAIREAWGVPERDR